MKTGDLVKYKMVPHGNDHHWVGLLTSFKRERGRHGHNAIAWVMWNAGNHSGQPIEEWVDELEMIR